MDTSGSVLRFPSFYLTTGYYMVTFTSQIVDNSLEGSTQQFLEMVPGPLLASIKGISQFILWDDNLTLDASSSFDRGYPSVMLSFEWYCQRGSVFPTGCFGGDNHYDIKKSTAVWEIAGRTLVKGLDYLFTVKVFNRHVGDGSVRESTAQQSVRLVDEGVPSPVLE